MRERPHTGKITKEKVLSVLSDRPKTAFQIAEELNVAHSTPTRHLLRLEAAGVVKKEPEGWVRIDVQKKGSDVSMHQQNVHEQKIEELTIQLCEIGKEEIDYEKLEDILHKIDMHKRAAEIMSQMEDVQ